MKSSLLEQPWQAVREGVQVKLLAQEGELYVLAESKDRVNKERAMRQAAIKRIGQTPQGVGQDGTDPGPTAAQAGRGQKPISGRLAAGQPSKCPEQKRTCVRPISPLRCAGTNCAKCGGGKVVIFCAATSARKNRKSCGSFTFN